MKEMIKKRRIGYGSWWIFNRTYFLAEVITLEKGPSDKQIVIEVVYGESCHMKEFAKWLPQKTGLNIIILNWY